MSAAPVINAPCGPVRGVTRPGSFAFLGIPFAEAPVGDLRFAAPVPKAPWSEVFDATEFGATPQRRSPFLVSTIPEPVIAGTDTLNLNVFTPTLAEHAELPVHVYIHGGGYIGGSHVGAWFDGATYNRDGVIVVTISYRLGFEGFGWIADAPRNRGLLDMVCALEWVRDNIRAFGGDPAKVTIAGQSAGGGAVLALLSMPMASGLFRGVIAHSPVIGIASVAEHESRGRDFAARLGVQSTVAAWSAVSEDAVLDAQFAMMKEGDPTHPMAGNMKSTVTAVGEVSMGWGPALDDETFPVAPWTAWREGLNRDVRVVVGATRDEFIFPPAAPTAEVARAWLLASGLPQPLIDFGIARIEAGDPDPLGRLATAIMFRLNVLDTADVRTEAGGRAWIYDFAQPSALNGMAMHCLELPFTWNCLQAEGAETVLGPGAPQELADEMHAAWVRFIQTGDPGWPQYDAGLAGALFGGGDATRTAYDDVRELHAAYSKARGVTA